MDSSTSGIEVVSSFPEEYENESLSFEKFQESEVRKNIAIRTQEDVKKVILILSIFLLILCTLLLFGLFLVFLILYISYISNNDPKKMTEVSIKVCENGFPNCFTSSTREVFIPSLRKDGFVTHSPCSKNKNEIQENDVSIHIFFNPEKYSLVQFVGEYIEEEEEHISEEEEVGEDATGEEEGCEEFFSEDKMVKYSFHCRWKCVYESDGEITEGGNNDFFGEGYSQFHAVLCAYTRCEEHAIVDCEGKETIPTDVEIILGDKVKDGKEKS